MISEGDHLIPVMVRLRIDERNEAEKIRTMHVLSARGDLAPLDGFASVNLKPEYANIAHFNKLRTVTVKAFSVFGELPSNVLKRARPVIDRMDLPPGCKLEYAGEAKELSKSRIEMGRVMQISLALIALAMVIPLTAVHIFGLLFAVLLTLVLLPVLYFIFCAKLRWIK